MGIYVVLYLLLLLCAIGSIILKNENRETKILLKTLLIFIGIIAGTRYEVGADFYSYLKIFKNINQNITEERLFVYAVRFFKIYIGDLQVFLVISMITMFFLYKAFISEIIEYRLLALYIYITSHFFPQNMGQIRFSLAIAMCLSTVNYLGLKMQNKEKIKAVLIMILAIFIQRTTIVFLITYFLVRIRKIKKRILLILLILSFFIGKYFINTKIIYFFGVILQNRKLISMLYLGNKYMVPVNFSMYQVYILITTLLILFYNSKNIKVMLLSKIYIFGTIFYFLFINLSIFSSRFSNMLLSVNCILFPLIISECKNKYLRMGLSCFCLLVGGYIYFSTLYKEIDILYPYKSWLFER